MSASAIDIALTHCEEPKTPVGPIRRTAFYLESGREPIFAWLHEHDELPRVDHGVIICPPIGYEQLHSHRALRHLADSLANETIPTLRFDWHGTGDSPGIDEDPHRYSTWLANVRDAAQWMREQRGCRHISLLGLRMGATLAALSTQRHEIDNLVLWSPVTKGRAYVREMKALSLTSEAQTRTGSTMSLDIEAAGFTLSSETAADVSQIDLMQCRPQCGRVLVVSRGDLREDNKVCDQWALTGVRVEQIATTNFAEMMAEPHRSQVPFSSIREITSWLTNACVSDESRNLVIEEERIRSSSVEMPYRSYNSTPTGTAFPIRESIFRIEEGADLFGIVSEPVRQVDHGSLWIVLLNAGSSYRIGPGRLNVLLARHFASRGFRCLRLDLSGLGDSPSEAADRENDPYPATAFREIERSLKEIERRFGAKRIVLMGLCSGAYAAFQSAAQIQNPALVESVLINPLTFFWKEGMTLENAASKQLMAFHYYLSVAIKPEKWLKLMSGHSKIGVLGAFRLVARRLRLLKKSAAANTSTTTDRRPGMDLSHPIREDVSGDLKRVVDAGRYLSMFFSKTDPGFSILNFHARRLANKLRAAGRLNIAFIDDSDHTFSIRAARADLIAAISEYLSQRYQ